MRLNVAMLRSWRVKGEKRKGWRRTITSESVVVGIVVCFLFLRFSLFAQCLYLRLFTFALFPLCI